MPKKAKAALTIHERLLETIGRVDRPGTFCTSGDLPLVMPGLEVDGLGPVRLPLGKTQARKLIKLCRQAPYGKGTETVVDTDVRRVWELNPEQFQLTNPKWDVVLPTIMGEVQEEWACCRSSVCNATRTPNASRSASIWPTAPWHR